MSFDSVDDDMFNPSGFKLLWSTSDHVLPFLKWDHFEGIQVSTLFLAFECSQLWLESRHSFLEAIKISSPLKRPAPRLRVMANNTVPNSVP
jgi:hypothetical protein